MDPVGQGHRRACFDDGGLQLLAVDAQADCDEAYRIGRGRSNTKKGC